MGAWGSDRIVLSITLFPSNMNKMRAEAKKGMDGLMADALWQSKRHESSTAKKMRGRKAGRKEERRGFSFLLLFSCSTSWYKHKKIIGVSKGNLDFEDVSWVMKQCHCYKVRDHCSDVLRFQAIHASGLSFEIFWRQILETQRDMESSGLFSSTGSSHRRDWNFEGGQKKAHSPFSITLWRLTVGNTHLMTCCTIVTGLCKKPPQAQFSLLSSTHWQCIAQQVRQQIKKFYS